MNRKMVEKPVAPPDTFFTDEVHRGAYLEETNRPLHERKRKEITYANARLMVPHRLASEILRSAVLLGTLGTVLAISLLWLSSLAHLGNLLVVVLGSAVLVVLGSWAAYFYYETRLESLFFGTAIDGVVVQSATVDKNHYTLTYEFKSPAGLVKSNTVKSAWAKSDSFSPPPTGTPIAIYYIDDDRFWLL